MELQIFKNSEFGELGNIEENGDDNELRFIIETCVEICCRELDVNGADGAAPLTKEKNYVRPVAQLSSIKMKIIERYCVEALKKNNKL